MKGLVLSQLNFLTRKILAKHQPKVVAITGSVGKTSTKSAIVTVLQPKFDVRGSHKSYNNELGLPLTVIGALTQGRSVFGWLGVLWKGWKTWLLDASYPEILVVEMGVDHPGEMDAYLELIQPDVAVVTDISESHLENFKKVENTLREKMKIVKALDKDAGVAVLNLDNEHLRGVVSSIKAQVWSYGYGEGVDFQAVDPIISLPRSFEAHLEDAGLSFKMLYEGNTVPVLIPNVLGQAQSYAALAACVVGKALGLNIIECAESLKHYEGVAGRTKLISGIKKTLLVDDTYNASPVSTAATIRTFTQLPRLNDQARKFLVLGDMYELGAYEEKGHREIGALVAREADADYLFTVGKLADYIADAAIKAGFSKDKVMSFEDSVYVGRVLQDQIQSGDMILVKGSQGIRCERIIKELMAEPSRAEELLVRQTSEWRDK